jgi:HK97 family phage portal protein
MGFLMNLNSSLGVAPQGVSGYSGLEMFHGAMSIPAFWRGSNLMADLLAQVPWDAYTSHGRDQEELIDPRPPLLEQPSPPLTRYSVLKSMMLDYLVNGNAIAIIASRDTRGVPTSIWPMPAAWCGVRRVTAANVSTSPLWVGAIEYSIGGVSYSSNDVLHVMGPSAPGAVRGFGILEAHFAGAMETAHQLQRDARNASRHGVPPGYIQFTGPEPIDGDELAQARDDWMRKRDEGGIAALNANLTFTPIAWNPDQMQLAEARQLSMNEMANLLGLPATFVNSSNSGSQSLTYATVDSEALGLLKWSMGGHFEQWSQTLSLAFPRGTCVRPDLDHFLRGDTQARYLAYQLGIDAGWLQRSEVRKMERLPPIAGIDDAPQTAAAQLKINKTEPVDVPAILQPHGHENAQGVVSVGAAPKQAALPAGGPPQAQQRAASRLPLTPNGRKLWDWLTSAEGQARYLSSPHPWTALRDFLLEHGVSPQQADGEATNVMLATAAGRVAFKAHHQGADHE